jgi:hypothetical protein
MYFAWIITLNRQVASPRGRVRWLGLGWGMSSLARKGADAHPFGIDG